jgi:hypothetical protein
VSATLTTTQRRHYAVVQSRALRAEQLAPLRAEIAAVIAEVGWARAKPVVAAALEPRWHVGGARGPWWEHVGFRSGERILAGLRAMPRQQRLALGAVTHPLRSIATKEVSR